MPRKKKNISVVVHYPDGENIDKFQERMNAAYVDAFESLINSVSDLQERKRLLDQTINYINQNNNKTIPYTNAGKQI